MKLLRIMWALSALWAGLFLYVAFDFLRSAWNTDAPLLEWGDKIKTYLAGFGALVVGALPLLGTWWTHRLYKSRERQRLAKQRQRIDKKIEKIDRKRAEKTAGGVS